MTDTTRIAPTTAGTPPAVAAGDRLATMPSGDLALYELQKPLIEPLLRLFRFTNTALDMLFYDVGAFTTAMLARGAAVETSARSNSDPASRLPLEHLDLSAVTNPEGSILVIDANTPPYVTRFDSMADFLAYANGPDGAGLRTVSITGVGSSALGSAAFAWNAAAALDEPVAAIVPGYGLADVVPQALGGWFGFGLHDWLQSTSQEFLAQAAPSLAQIGKRLARTTPGREMAPSGAPVFRYGSAASDDLHAVLEQAPRITRVVGHSKGALAIANALRSLPGERTERLAVLTFGCVIDEELPRRDYAQYLGVVDPLGILNSWGHQPERPLFSHHSTNTLIPLNMPVAELIEEAGGRG